MPFQTFQDLPLWQKAHELVLHTYSYSKRFPADEQNGLSIQLRKSATSIASHVAEGFNSVNPGRRMQYLTIAMDTLNRYRYFLILSEDLMYGKSKELVNYTKEVEELLKAYLNHTKNNLAIDFVA